MSDVLFWAFIVEIGLGLIVSMFGAIWVSEEVPTPIKKARYNVFVNGHALWAGLLLATLFLAITSKIFN